MELFVPGRICLFGEHSDWAGGYRRINSAVGRGYTIITGTNQGLYARVSPAPGRLIFRSRDASGEPLVLDEPLESRRLIEIAEGGGFFSYVAGVAYQVLTHYHVDGIEIDNYRTDLPVQKGLSSSAAVCVLTARAFNRVYDLKMTVRGEMEMAYRGEITTPSRCGRMDQGCAYGERPIEMRFDGDALDVDELHVGRALHFVIVDLKAHKDTVRILADLNRAFPFADNPVQEAVQGYLGPENARIVAAARRAIESGDVETLGALMGEAQRAFDAAMQPACPEELTSPVLHRLLAACVDSAGPAAHPALSGLVLGGKGVGSQGDGTAQLLVRDAAAQHEVIDILAAEFGMEGLALTVPATKRVRKAVITAAGHGTRLFPMTKIIRKEFMPVRDGGGNMVPLIVAHILDAVDAGVEEIALIIQPEEEVAFRRLLHDPVEPEVFAKLSAENKERARRIEAAGRRVVFLPQREQRGLGHAVLSAREWIGEEPFLLVLGDHYFVAGAAGAAAAGGNGAVGGGSALAGATAPPGVESCYRQMIRAYDTVDGALIGLATTPEAEVGRFGTVTGSWEGCVDPGRVGAGSLGADASGSSASADCTQPLLAVSELKEKPSRDYAREYLRVEGLPSDQYFTVFGLYILPPRLLAILADAEAAGDYEHGELQLTGALDHLRAEGGMRGVAIDGRKVDIGIPEEFAAIWREREGTA